jgi:UDP-N-acetylglucosamine--N-acetylmuramyl-(pentapeptide) pyrophosphoryl-undecaprenol N-acetylglucosamine transferase
MTAEERDAALGRLILTTELEDLAGCDIVIEAVVERLDVKRDLFAALEGILDADAILTTNTSALSVTEIAAVGVASLLVPFPHAVDDHQTLNAEFLSQSGAAWLMAQGELTPERLAQLLGSVTRPGLLAMAQKAHALRQTQAVQTMVHACTQLVGEGA